MKTLPTRHRALLSIGAIALMFLGAAPGITLPAAKSQESHPADITVEAASSETDFKTHTLHLRGDVLITYGTLTVRSDRAFVTAGDFKNSRWTFDGNVRINAQPHGNLRSDEAVVEIEDSQLKRATATGNPAEFDQKREGSDLVTRGHAKEIVYEVGAGTVRLSTDAWVLDDKGTMTGPEITYDLRQERVEASTTTGTERVHVTIPANEVPKLDNGANKPKSTAGDGHPPDTPASTGSTPSAPATTNTAPGTTTPEATPASPPPSGSGQAAPQSPPH